MQLEPTNSVDDTLRAVERVLATNRQLNDEILGAARMVQSLMGTIRAVAQRQLTLVRHLEGELARLAPEVQCRFFPDTVAELLDLAAAGEEGRS